MNIVERAAAYRTVRDAGLSSDSISRSVSKTRGSVEMTLVVNELPNEVKAFTKATPTVMGAEVYKAAARCKRDRTADV